MKMTEIICSHCGKTVEKPLKEIKRRKKIGKTKFYCSLSCSTSDTSPKLAEWNNSAENKKRLASHAETWNENRLDEYWVVREPMRRVRQRVKTGAYNGTTDLTLEYLLEVWNKQNGKCVYTNVDLNPVMSGCSNRDHDKNYQSSLDRIDSAVGYMKGNVQFVSVTVNWLKNDQNNNHVDEFFKIVQKINILTEI